MLVVGKVLPQGRGLSAVLKKRAASIELDWEVRQRSRFEAIDTQDRALGVFLPRGHVVRGGDVLVAEDGSLIRVIAKPQEVMIVRACAEHGSSFDLLRAAYHLGNRHVQLQLEADHLKLEPDHVLAEMLERMHLIVTAANEAFEPESGAYAAGGSEHGHAHGHQHEREPGHDHDHDHDHGHEHEHAHEHAHEHEQKHGHAEVREHDHEHRHAGEHVRAHGDAHEHPQAHGETPDPAGEAEPDSSPGPGPAGKHTH